MGLLSVFLAVLAILAGRIVQTHLFVFPEWKKIVSAVEIPPEREQLYLMMGRLFSSDFRGAGNKELIEENSTLIATAVSSLILDKQLTPATGQELYMASHMKVDRMKCPLDPNTVELQFNAPPLTEAWPRVTDRLREWNTPQKRADAARAFLYRQLFLMEQCRYKALLDDYPMALSTGFFVSGGCVFLMLRFLYCLVGLIGAYKTCSQSFMD